MHHASLLSSNGHHFTFTSKIISQQINVFIVPGSWSHAVRAPPRGRFGDASEPDAGARGRSGPGLSPLAGLEPGP